GTRPLHGVLVLRGSSRRRRFMRGRQADETAQILVIEARRYEIGIDERSLLAHVQREVPGEVAVADLAREIVKRPHLAAVLQLPVQTIRRRPRKRHRNDRIALTAVAALPR